MTNIIFETPAERPNPDRTDWEAVTEELKARPGEWAVVKTNTSAATATQIKQGQLRAFRPKQEWEACTRNVDPSGRAEKIYARWIGPNAEYA
jgi:hypothetical protein